MSERVENIAIETLKEIASDDFDTLGDDISPKMAQNILNLISNQRKEIEREKQYTNFYEYLCNKQQKIIEELQKDKKVLIKNYDRVLGTFINKDKIREKIIELEDKGYWNFLEERDLKLTIRILQKLLEEK